MNNQTFISTSYSYYLYFYFFQLYLFYLTVIILSQCHFSISYVAVNF